MISKRTQEIARLNDLARQCRGNNVRLFITSGVDALWSLDQIMALVAAYSDFSSDNDPYWERDFGRFNFSGHQLYWKIDYYDQDINGGSSDPSDPEVTTRVLTILLPEEW